MDVEGTQIGRAVRLGFQEVRHVALLAAVVSEPGGSIREYAKLLRLSKPVISRGCSYLVEQGYATSKAHPEDKRLCVMAPTERGRRACTEVFGRENMNGAVAAKPTRTNRPARGRAIARRGPRRN